MTAKQLGDVGAFGIIGETFGLFKGNRPHRTLLMQVQFGIILPCTIYSVLTQFLQPLIIEKVFSGLIPPPPPQPHPPLQDVPSNGSHSWIGLLLLLLLLLAWLALSVIVGLVGTAVVYKAVGSIRKTELSGESRTSTLGQVLQGLPQLLGKLFVTNLWGGFFIFLCFLLMTGAVALSSKITPLTSVILIIFFLIPVFYIAILSEVAKGVTTFEGQYGLSAYRKGKNIMTDKWVSAVGLCVLYGVIVGVVAGFSMKFKLDENVAHKSKYIWSGIGYIVYTLLASWLTQLYLMSWALFYFSCIEKNKNFGNEAAGYMPVPSEV